MDIWQMAETLVGYFGADGAAEEARQRATECEQAGRAAEAQEWQMVALAVDWVDGEQPMIAPPAWRKAPPKPRLVALARPRPAAPKPPKRGQVLAFKAKRKSKRIRRDGEKPPARPGRSKHTDE